MRPPLPGPNPRSRLPAGVTSHVEPGQKVPRLKSLTALAKKVVKGEGLKGRLNLVFCSDALVRGLNRRYRKLDKVTDVLSFPWKEKDFAGEIFIACPQAYRQSKSYKTSFFNELQRLVIHGVLHVAGYDHVKAKERGIMRKREYFYMNT